MASAKLHIADTSLGIRQTSLRFIAHQCDKSEFGTLLDAGRILEQRGLLPERGREIEKIVEICTYCDK